MPKKKKLILKKTNRSKFKEHDTSVSSTGGSPGEGVVNDGGVVTSASAAESSLKVNMPFKPTNMDVAPGCVSVSQKSTGGGMSPETTGVGISLKTAGVGISPKTAGVGVSQKTTDLGVSPPTSTVGVSPGPMGLGISPKLNGSFTVTYDYTSSSKESQGDVKSMEELSQLFTFQSEGSRFHWHTTTPPAPFRPTKRLRPLQQVTSHHYQDNSDISHLVATLRAKIHKTTGPHPPGGEVSDPPGGEVSHPPEGEVPHPRAVTSPCLGDKVYLDVGATSESELVEEELTRISDTDQGLDETDMGEVSINEDGMDAAADEWEGDEDTSDEEEQTFWLLAAHQLNALTTASHTTAAMETTPHDVGVISGGGDVGVASKGVGMAPRGSSMDVTPRRGGVGVAPRGGGLDVASSGDYVSMAHRGNSAAPRGGGVGVAPRGGYVGVAPRGGGTGVALGGGVGVAPRGDGVGVAPREGGRSVEPRGNVLDVASRDVGVTPRGSCGGVAPREGGVGVASRGGGVGVASRGDGVGVASGGGYVGVAPRGRGNVAPRNGNVAPGEIGMGVVSRGGGTGVASRGGGTGVASRGGGTGVASRGGGTGVASRGGGTGVASRGGGTGVAPRVVSRRNDVGMATGRGHSDRGGEVGVVAGKTIGMICRGASMGVACSGRGRVVAGRGGVVAGRGGMVAGRGGVVAGRGGVVAGRGRVVAGKGGVVAGRGGSDYLCGLVDDADDVMSNRSHGDVAAARGRPGDTHLLTSNPDVPLPAVRGGSSVQGVHKLVCVPASGLGHCDVQDDSTMPMGGHVSSLSAARKPGDHPLPTEIELSKDVGPRVEHVNSSLPFSRCGTPSIRSCYAEVPLPTRRTELASDSPAMVTRPSVAHLQGCQHRVSPLVRPSRGAMTTGRNVLRTGRGYQGQDRAYIGRDSDQGRCNDKYHDDQIATGMAATGSHGSRCYLATTGKPSDGAGGRRYNQTVSSASGCGDSSGSGTASRGGHNQRECAIDVCRSVDQGDIARTTEAGVGGDGVCGEARDQSCAVDVEDEELEEESGCDLIFQELIRRS